MCNEPFKIPEAAVSRCSKYSVKRLWWKRNIFIFLVNTTE